MAKYKSKYLALSFYVNDEREQFSGGVFETQDDETIAVLDGITDAVKQTEAKPATKAPARKPSAK